MNRLSIMNADKKLIQYIFALLVFTSLLILSPLNAAAVEAAENTEANGSPRQLLNLNGQWQVAEGSMQEQPSSFAHTVPVPGLIDMASPAFADAGFKSPRREAFWYRKTFKLDSPLPGVALLKLHKAMFGARVILNGKTLGEHYPSFTPGYFDAHDALKPGENELLIRVGAYLDNVPSSVPSGWDYEKLLFIPGIFDSVELIMSELPAIRNLQLVPDIKHNTVKVHAWIDTGGAKVKPELNFLVKEAASGKVVGKSSCICTCKTAGTIYTGIASIPISKAQLWSPEHPFLYEIEARSTGDAMTTRFGMRSFALDKSTGRAMLNGRPYFMRGSNVTLYRFFEDTLRKDKPWSEEWVRLLHKRFKDMNWNSLRYSIGFPPELWYRIADEEGILIQDEFPIWNMDAKAGEFDAEELAREYKEWMQERWNHPCVVIWDACNETNVPETGKAISKVRKLDYSNRPWDNGWCKAVSASDCKEMHPYHFQDPDFKFSQISKDPGTLDWKPGKNPIIINEYGWLWLNRDGTPTALTRRLYKNLLGANSTTEERRKLYAKYMAAETEFWRSHRACAGVMQFCALGYSRPGQDDSPKAGATSDHWLDLEKLQWEPLFYSYGKNSFSPIGIMIDAWEESYPAGEKRRFSVPVINDLEKPWSGTLQFKLLEGTKEIESKTADCSIPAWGKKTFSFELQIPNRAGDYQLEASLTEKQTADGPPVLSPCVFSFRDFNVH